MTYLKYTFIVFFTFLLASCVMPKSQFSGPASIFISSVEPLSVNDDGLGNDKVGRACTTNILSLVISGDSSIEKASNNGNVKKVNTVDQEKFGILNIFGSVCTVVHGH